MKKVLTGFLMVGMILSMGAGKKNQQTAKKTMNSVFRGFLGLVPFMNSQMKFKDPANKEEIHTHLTTLKNAFENAKHVKTFEMPGFNPSFEQAKTHLKETLEAFEGGQPDFARVRLRATGQLCISCHTQLKGNRGSFGPLNTLSRSDFSSDYEFAEFLFLIRNYRKAERYFEKEINEAFEKSRKLSKVSKVNSFAYRGNKIERSLEKTLTIHTKVKYAPEKVLPIVQKYSRNKYIDSELKGKMEGWIASLKKWKRSDYKGRIKNANELRSFIDKNLSKYADSFSSFDGRNDVDLLVASGALYQYLYKKPRSKDTPEVLFWLSKVDEHLNNSFLFSLSELYLKRCITDYGKTKWGPKCYRTYRDKISHGYTGSGGVFIPKDEVDELKRLKSFLN